jgi:hypothetical protein
MVNRALAVMHGVLTHPGIASLALPSLSGKPQRGRKRNFITFLADIAA